MIIANFWRDERESVLEHEVAAADTVDPRNATFDISDRSCVASCEAAVEGYEARVCLSEVWE